MFTNVDVMMCSYDTTKDANEVHKRRSIGTTTAKKDMIITTSISLDTILLKE